MRLIGAGFGRTGTYSLKTALERIGYGPCYHMLETFDKPRHIQLWHMAADGQPVDWDELLGSYQACVDWPACTFYAQLLERYPGARVLLSVRDPERWYASVINTNYSQGPVESDHGAMARAVIWDGTFHGRLEDKAYALAVYAQHLAEVKAHVPAERLLVYDVKQGWEPLCAFLDVPMHTNTPFPHLNDTASFREFAHMPPLDKPGA